MKGENANSAYYMLAGTIIMVFDKFAEAMNSRPLILFSQLNQIPEDSGVYTGWLEGDQHCFYVGKATNLRSRIRSHYSGQRGSDQFCLYVYDNFVHDQRLRGLTTQKVNKITSDWIRGNVKFKIITLPENETHEVEVLFRKHWKPTLNPL
jgi:hypothetical protein